jgi:hypothetical protein
MRRSLVFVVKTYNDKSQSPAWTERDFLTRVFQKNDKARNNGRNTGDCDLEMFLSVGWCMLTPG